MDPETSLIRMSHWRGIYRPLSETQNLHQSWLYQERRVERSSCRCNVAIPPGARLQVGSYVGQQRPSLGDPENPNLFSWNRHSQLAAVGIGPVRGSTESHSSRVHFVHDEPCGLRCLQAQRQLAHLFHRPGIDQKNKASVASYVRIARQRVRVALYDVGEVHRALEQLVVLLQIILTCPCPSFPMLCKLNLAIRNVVRSIIKGQLDAGNLGNVDVGLTVSPDHRTILYSRVDSSIDDLMLVENFR